MASLYKEETLDVSADTAWAILRRPENAPKIFAPVLVDGTMTGDIRTVRFANGMVVDERIVAIDDDRRRIAYTAIKGSPMTHHNASMQIVDDGPTRCRFVWITDVLPNEMIAAIEPLVEQGARALKKNLERGA
jgi:Polyketide cyclase / dehydrase and lipid transport